MRDAIEVSAATEIDAPPAAVWAVLTDLARFHAWNPFIRAARGATGVGDAVRVRVRPSLPVPLVFHATVSASDEPRALRWDGHVLARWFARGDHTFEIAPLGDGRSRFVQRERFSGILPRLGARLLAREARRGFVAMNRALKQRVEAATGAPHASG
jgi:hypothetical protein